MIGYSWISKGLVASLLISLQAGDIMAQQSAKTDVVKRSAITIGHSYQLESEVYQSDREINVWTPPSYIEGDTQYSVLYVIDGGLDQDFHHISGIAQVSTLNAQFEELIIVGIKTENRMNELTHEPKDPRYIREPAVAGGSDRFVQHINDEVIPFIKTNYRVNQNRAVIGESLAGLFIAEVFLRHPDTFTHYVSISPSLWWDDKGLAKTAPESLAKHDGKKRYLYLTMASEGGTMQGGLDMMMEAINANKPTGLSWEYVDRRDSERHSTIYHGAAHDAIKKMFVLPFEEPTEMPWYLIEGAQPPKDDADKK